MASFSEVKELYSSWVYILLQEKYEPAMKVKSERKKDFLLFQAEIKKILDEARTIFRTNHPAEDVRFRKLLKVFDQAIISVNVQSIQTETSKHECFVSGADDVPTKEIRQVSVTFNEKSSSAPDTVSFMMHRTFAAIFQAYAVINCWQRTVLQQPEFSPTSINNVVEKLQDYAFAIKVLVPESSNTILWKGWYEQQ